LHTKRIILLVYTKYTQKRIEMCVFVYGESRSVKFTRRFTTEHVGKMQVVLLNAA
jgi:hypothetical protein